MMNDSNKKFDNSNTSRRSFIKSSAALGGITMLTGSFTFPENHSFIINNKSIPKRKSIIGGYGNWADGLRPEIPSLSFRSNNNSNLKKWKKKAISKAEELISAPKINVTPPVTIDKKYEYDNLEIEELSWQLPYGDKTEAILLKPVNAKGPLPGIIGLHDHGGNKYFGKRKITTTSNNTHPVMIEHQNHSYEGTAWANEIAKRGYVVLVHDAFAFASRRVLFADMSTIPWGHCATKGLSDEHPEETENVERYNSWATDHEHIMAKSLFCAGTTWPGAFLAEDQVALSILCDREDVDTNQVGCAGLSGGGLRTVFLGGLDHRIKCAVCVGFMSTWSDFLLNKAYTHTWMTYAPLLPKYLDFPEILGLRVPLPTMVLNNNQDSLYTLPEMKNADTILKEVFNKAEAADQYKGLYYDGHHKFDKQMQKDAFDWFDQWLK